MGIDLEQYSAHRFDWGKTHNNTAGEGTHGRKAFPYSSIY